MNPAVDALLSAVARLERQAKEHLAVRRAQMEAPHCEAHERFEYSCGECLSEADKRI